MDKIWFQFRQTNSTSDKGIWEHLRIKESFDSIALLSAVYFPKKIAISFSHEASVTGLLTVQPNQIPILCVYAKPYMRQQGNHY